MAFADSTTLANAIKPAWNRAILMGYAPNTFLRPFCNEGQIKGDTPVPGNPIGWTVIGQLAPATTPLP